MDLFGPILGYKYYYKYCTTLNGVKKENCLEVLKKEVSRLYFKNKNILYDVKTWKDFFHKIREEIAENVLYRIKK